MMYASGKTEDFRVGYIVLTDAEDKRPFLVQIDQIVGLSFAFHGGEPFVMALQHRVGADVVETTLCEELRDVLQLIRQTSSEVEAWNEAVF